MPELIVAQNQIIDLESRIAELEARLAASRTLLQDTCDMIEKEYGEKWLTERVRDALAGEEKP